jgi:hypothetical protein
MQSLVERGCGLDVHQATVVACFLIVSRNGKVRKQMRPKASTCCFLSSLKTFAMPTEATRPPAGVNVLGVVLVGRFSGDYPLSLAGFG